MSHLSYPRSFGRRSHKLNRILLQYSIPYGALPPPSIPVHVYRAHLTNHTILASYPKLTHTPNLLIPICIGTYDAQLRFDLFVFIPPSSSHTSPRAHVTSSNSLSYVYHVPPSLIVHVHCKQLNVSFRLVWPLVVVVFPWSQSISPAIRQSIPSLVFLPSHIKSSPIPLNPFTIHQYHHKLTMPKMCHIFYSPSPFVFLSPPGFCPRLSQTYLYYYVSSIPRVAFLVCVVRFSPFSSILCISIVLLYQPIQTNTPRRSSVHSYSDGLLGIPSDQYLAYIFFNLCIMNSIYLTTLLLLDSFYCLLLLATPNRIRIESQIVFLCQSIESRSSEVSCL